MFDVGFSEMLVIGIVALVVIGPEKLPRVARTVGALLGRMQRYVNDVKADINREMELDELKKLQTTVQDAAASIQTSMNETVSGFQSQADELNKIASGDVAGLTETKPAEVRAEGEAVAGDAGVTPALTAADTAVPAVSSSAAVPAIGGTATVASASVPAAAEDSQSPIVESGSHQALQASLFTESAPTNALGAEAPSKPAVTV